MSTRILFHNKQCPGDYVAMTAALRDLHQCHPGKYEVGVQTMQPQIFQFNPYVKPMAAAQTEYVLGYSKGPYRIHDSKHHKLHFMQAWIGEMNTLLKTNVYLTDFKPDLYLSEEEKANPLVPRPYWVCASGGKSDFTAKIWDPQSWQTVVNAMRPWTTLVQVGGTGGGSHNHPPLEGVVNLVGKTTIRELMRLIYHSEGVMCIVTCFMHIAAAFNKPAVVVAGGREEATWEGYTVENRLVNMRIGQPNWHPPSPDNFIPHQYLHTIGELDCCKTHGCWRNKVHAPGSQMYSGSECIIPVLNNQVWIPRCLQMITPERVLAAVDWYYDQGILSRKAVISQPRNSSLQETPKLEVFIFTSEENNAHMHAIKQFEMPGISLTFVKSSEGRQAGLRRALKANRSNYLVWLEEPFIPKGGFGFWLELIKATETRIVLGCSTWSFLPSDMWEIENKKEWFKDITPERHSHSQDKMIVRHPERGIFIIPAGLISEEHVPEDDALFEVRLGLLLHASKIKIRDIGEAVECL